MFYDYHDGVEGAIKMIGDAVDNPDLQEFIDFCVRMEQMDIEEENNEDLELMK